MSCRCSKEAKCIDWEPTGGTVHPHLQHMRTQRYLKMQAVHLTRRVLSGPFLFHTGIVELRGPGQCFPLLDTLCKYRLHFHADFFHPYHLTKMLHVSGNALAQPRYLFTPVNRLPLLPGFQYNNAFVKAERIVGLRFVLRTHAMREGTRWNRRNSILLQVLYLLRRFVVRCFEKRKTNWRS